MCCFDKVTAEELAQAKLEDEAEQESAFNAESYFAPPAPMSGD